MCTHSCEPPRNSLPMCSNFPLFLKPSAPEGPTFPSPQFIPRPFQALDSSVIQPKVLKNNHVYLEFILALTFPKSIKMFFMTGERQPTSLFGIPVRNPSDRNTHSHFYLFIYFCLVPTEPDLFRNAPRVLRRRPPTPHTPTQPGQLCRNFSVVRVPLSPSPSLPGKLTQQPLSAPLNSVMLDSLLPGAPVCQGPLIHLSLTTTKSSEGAP